MNEGELNELLTDHPILFHMAECGSWPSILRHGLLSTSALLDLTDVQGDKRLRIESKRRAENVELFHEQHGRFIIRDNKPMDDVGLLRCLQDSLQPAHWYSLLNHRVFFWLTKDRLHRLLSARPYFGKSHDVIELDARRLVSDYRLKITLSPINSGCTKPVPVPRGLDTFLPIDRYPYSTWQMRRRGREPVVELCVDYGIPDIEPYVLRVSRMRAQKELEVLFEH